MSTEIVDPVVAEFEQRRAEPPREIRVGSVATYPALDLEEEGATCTLCGYWGVVPAQTDVLEALVRGTEQQLVCATCASELDLEEGSS